MFWLRFIDFVKKNNFLFSFQAKIFKLLLNEMVAVEVLETSEDYDDDDDEDDDDTETDENVEKHFEGKSVGQTIELSAMLDAVSKNHRSEEVDDDNDFEDPDARFVNVYFCRSYLC